jgi:hypothetical protein
MAHSGAHHAEADPRRSKRGASAEFTLLSAKEESLVPDSKEIGLASGRSTLRSIRQLRSIRHRKGRYHL